MTRSGGVDAINPRDAFKSFPRDGPNGAREVARLPHPSIRVDIEVNAGIAFVPSGPPSEQTRTSVIRQQQEELQAPSITQSQKITPAQAARNYAARFLGRIVNVQGLEGVFRRMRQSEDMVDRRAAASELARVNNLLVNGYHGVYVVRLRVLPPTNFIVTPDIELDLADGRTGIQYEIRTFTTGARGKTQPHGPTHAATEVRRRKPITRSQLQSAILSKAQHGQINRPGGTLAIPILHRSLDIQVADSAIALLPLLNPNIEYITIILPGKKKKVTLTYRRQQPSQVFIRQP